MSLQTAAMGRILSDPRFEARVQLTRSFMERHGGTSVDPQLVAEILYSRDLAIDSAVNSARTDAPASASVLWSAHDELHRGDGFEASGVSAS